jgi:hypothetical protein
MPEVLVEFLLEVADKEEEYTKINKNDAIEKSEIKIDRTKEGILKKKEFLMLRKKRCFCRTMRRYSIDYE